jgi:hypothetical protein
MGDSDKSTNSALQQRQVCSKQVPVLRLSRHGSREEPFSKGSARHGFAEQLFLLPTYSCALCELLEATSSSLVEMQFISISRLRA